MRRLSFLAALLLVVLELAWPAAEVMAATSCHARRGAGIGARAAVPPPSAGRTEGDMPASGQSDPEAEMPCHTGAPRTQSAGAAAADERAVAAQDLPAMRSAESDCCRGHFACGLAGASVAPMPPAFAAAPRLRSAGSPASPIGAVIVASARPLDHVPLA